LITAHSRSATCLNCGVPAPGEYCGNCGQRNHQLRASLWHLASEIASEAFEFDSRIRRTLFPFFFKFVNVLPKLMFVLLPLLAFVLKVLYFGSGRFYVEHVIFTMHVQAFAFLVAIPAVATHSQILGAATGIWILGYELVAMRKVYAQSWGKTILKFSLLQVSFSVLEVIGVFAAALTGFLSI